MLHRIANRFLVPGILLLLIVSGFGLLQLWQWAETAGLDRATLVSNFTTVAVPLVLCALLALMAGFVQPRAFGAEGQTENGQQRLRYQEDLVRLIADYRPGATAIIDAEGRYWFVNASHAAQYKMKPNDMVGKSVDKALGPTEGAKLKRLLQQARDSGQQKSVINHVRGADGDHFVSSTIIPLPSIAGLTNAMMVNEDDITSLMVEREARLRTFRQVIDTLVAVVDRRDPYAAGHSARVGQVARMLAEQMELNAGEVETAEIAGLLMNFGKVLVPREILTKTGQLTPEELKQVRESILTSADILALIGFSLPVVPTLRQVLERYDGTGVPDSRKGDAILITARIVTIANAFVAMVSARAHRAGLSSQKALENMTADNNKAFDGKIVAALSVAIGKHAGALPWLAKT